MRAERMGERIETLEAILDDETPGWRSRLSAQGFLGSMLMISATVQKEGNRKRWLSYLFRSTLRYRKA